MEKMHRSMTTYVKAISKRKEGDDKEKTLPIAHLGSVMIQHGEDFDSHSDFGRSLACMLQIRPTLLSMFIANCCSSDWKGPREACPYSGTFANLIKVQLL